jgi:hypothetical protein
MSDTRKMPDKATRHKIYISALEYFKSNTDYGLCSGLTYCYENQKKYNGYIMSKSNPTFPEVAKHITDRANISSWWFPIKDIESRISILEQAIKETE